MTVKELRAVLTLAKNENAEISFSTEPGVAFGVSSFDDDGEDFWVLLDTAEWKNRVDKQSTLCYNHYRKLKEREGKMARKYYLYTGSTPEKFYDNLEDAQREVEEREKAHNDIYGNIYLRYEHHLRKNKNTIIYKKLSWNELKNKNNEIRYVLGYEISYDFNISKKYKDSACFCIKYFDF